MSVTRWDPNKKRRTRWDASTTENHLKPAEELQPVPKLQFVNILPYDVTSYIYEAVLEDSFPGRTKLGTWYYRMEDRRAPCRPRMAQKLGFVDPRDLTLWGYLDKIELWYGMIAPAFYSREEWYYCHRMGQYKNAVKDMTLRAHEDTVEAFRDHYWQTRVVDMSGGEIEKFKGFENGAYYCTGPKQWRRYLDINSDNYHRMKNLALEFDSYQAFDLRSRYDTMPGRRRRGRQEHRWWKSEHVEIPSHERPNSIQPSKQFRKLCRQIRVKIPNLETLYLWLVLSLDEVLTLLHAPENEPCELVQLMRKMPIRKDGRFVIKLRINPNKSQTRSKDELLLDSDDNYVRLWEGQDGPERYGKDCRTFEEKLEILMRPTSLGPYIEEKTAENPATADAEAKEKESVDTSISIMVKDYQKQWEEKRKTLWAVEILEARKPNKDIDLDEKSWGNTQEIIKEAEEVLHCGIPAPYLFRGIPLRKVQRKKDNPSS